MTGPGDGTAPNDTRPGAGEFKPGVGGVLERMRKKLLDLSAKNQLLNYRHPKGRSLRVIDEIASQLFERLTEGRPMYFAPLIVPREMRRTDAAVADDPKADRKAKMAAKRARDAGREARARTYAAEKGINTSYELPLKAGSHRHADDAIQTLREPEELAELLRKIEREAKTYIQEQGANRLYLMFGFVEWGEPSTEGGEESTKRLAPLVLLPVQINREAVVVPDTRTFRYRITPTGEDWDINVTLREKCKTEFGFDFPDINEDESLDAYLQRVKRGLENAPRGWSLKVMVTLGFVSFGKILMWRDLDPKRWPDNSFFKFEPIGDLLGDRSQSADDVGADESTWVEEYDIDSQPEETLPPVVIDADSSQHSALIDALKGRDLVIQGPPGTGKSQTITNLIAAAIAAGKRVLFVAEKRAALDVVHRRLNQAGLGPFILALHSHTAQKRELLDDLNQRIALADAGNGGMRAPIEAPAGKDRKRLNDHVGRLHSDFGALGQSPFEILWRARRLIDQLDPGVREQVERLRIPNAVAVTPAQFRAALDAVEDFSPTFDEVLKAGNGDISQHPWHGIRRTDISSASVEEIIELSRDVKRHLEACVEKADGITTHLELRTKDSTPSMQDSSVVDSVDQARTFAGKCSALQAPPDGLPPELVSIVAKAKNRDEYRAAIKAVGDARTAWAQVVHRWGHLAVVGRGVLDNATSAVAAAKDRFGADQTVDDLAGLRASCGELLRDLRAAELVAEEWRRALGKNAEDESSSRVQVRFALAIAATLKASLHVDERLLAVRVDGLKATGATEALQALSLVALELKGRAKKLDGEFDPIVRPPESELQAAVRAISLAWRGVLALLQSEYRKATKTYRVMSGGKRAERNAMLEGMRSVLRHQRALREFSAREDLRSVLGKHANGIDSPFAIAERAAVWYQAIHGLLRELGPEHADAIEKLWTGAPERVLQMLDRLRDEVALGEALNASAHGHHLESRIGETWSELLDASLAVVQSSISAIAAHIVAIESLSATLGAPSSASLSDFMAHLQDLKRAFAADDEVRRHADTFSRAGMVLSGADTDVRALQDALAYLDRLDALHFQPAVANWLCGYEPAARAKWLKRACRDLVAGVESLETRLHGFASLTSLDESDWLSVDSGDLRRQSLSQSTFVRQIERLDLALAHERSLHQWARYLRARAVAQNAGAKDVVALIETRALASSAGAMAHEAALYRTLSSALFAAIPELDGFSGAQHEQVRLRFQTGDVQDLRRTQVGIAQRLNAAKRHHGTSYSMRVADLNDEALIKHEAGKKTRHIAIRELFRRAGAAIGALKPCVMMGPQAVAQFLRAGQFEFDLLVMDEASQMRPEDALGAVARSKQVVIVGDPMQLGPSAFFDAQSDGFEEDDDYLASEVEMAERDSESAQPEETLRGPSVLERSESILTAAAQRYPVRMLRWHYRSRHPKLIAFSNREFYNGRLIVFPTPTEGATADGVVFTYVSDAVYGEQRNPREAERIVEAVRLHARVTPQRSLMVATMNLHQADLIDQLLERAEKTDAALASFRARHAETPEPFDVKNLENVQGDERDVVIVSVTAGPDSNGKLSLVSFGAVTKRGGERRLNVLFTRARQRTEVFCSFDPSSIQAEGKSEGVRVMREYLLYAADANWAVGTQSGRVADSDFEIAVMDALRAHGWEVHPQVGIAGYFIDLAIGHPDYPGRYLLGIECDGAAYHSAKSARDRDRLRQTVLEGLGWRIHRIWSTDWFRDPIGQAARVTEVAQHALAKERQACSIRPAAVDGGEMHLSSSETAFASSDIAGPAQRDDVEQPRSSVVSTNQTVLRAGKSKDLVVGAISNVLGPERRVCPTCGSKRRVWIDKQGPFVRCDNSDCRSRETVPFPLLSEALRALGASCDCGARMRVASGVGGSTFLGCTDYPSHRRSLNWTDL